MIPYEIDENLSTESWIVGDVKAGFPSPAEDIHEKLDLIKLLVRNPASTFFFRIDGVSMVDAAMDEGDIIIVDRSIDPFNGCMAVCYIDGGYTVKRVEVHGKELHLLPANMHNLSYKPIIVTPDNQFMVWGLVTYVIKKV